MKILLLHKGCSRIMLFISAALFSSLSNAQYYKTVYLNSERYFINQHGLIKAIHIDSSAVVASDTLYYNFNSIREDTINCIPEPGNQGPPYTPYGASWIGKHVMIQPDGSNLFFNKTGDTIFINTRAELNDSWKLFRFENGDYIEAVVSEVSTDTFFGLIDSTKTISLQLKDNLDNEMQHDINSIMVVLSQHYGLLKTFDFYEFPGETMQYTLTDKKRLTTREVYDFEIGDERQVYNYQVSYYFSIRKYKHEKIVNKYYTLMQDTLFYEIQVKTFEYERISYDMDSFIFNEKVELDTLTVSYTRLDEPVIDAMPEESIISNYDLWDYSFFSIDTFLGGKRHAVYGNYNLISANDTCWHEVVDGESLRTLYIEGLGDLFFVGWSMGGYYEEELIYYKKGTDVYGELYTHLEETPAFGISVSVFPNPLTNYARVEFALTAESVVSIGIFDLHGRKMKTLMDNEKVPSGKNQRFITLGDMPHGIYLLIVSSENTRSCLKVVKME